MPMSGSRLESDRLADPRDARLESNPVEHVRRLIETARQERPGRPDLSLLERHLVTRIQSRGIRFPSGYLRSLGIEAPAGPARPGVLALVVAPGERNRTGLVDRLHARRADRWTLRNGLPFDATDLLLLARDVLSATPESLEGVVPESLAFQIGDELREPIEGPSMTVACFLALLDSTTGHRHPLLAATVAIVQPAEDRRLDPVEGLPEKLEAFAREVEHGRLLVCHPETEIGEHEERFEEVWRVRDLDGFGEKLDAAGLLDEIRARHMLDAAQLSRVEGVFRELLDRRYRPARALDLGRRVAACEFGPDVSARRGRRARAMPIGPLRLLALGREAATEARAFTARVERAGANASYTEQAEAAIDLAAAHYVAHQFEEARATLVPWACRVTDDPLLLDNDITIRLLGTLGRAEIALGGDSWLEPVDRAIQIQRFERRADLPRAIGILIDGLLRTDRLEEAEEQLKLAETELRKTEYESNVDLWFLRFRRAELARRRAEIWGDPLMENPDIRRQGQFARPIAYYYQATARQPGRSDEDAADRLRQAAHAFASITRDRGITQGLRFFESMMRLAEAERRGDGSTWARARNTLVHYLDHEAPLALRRWYEPVIAELGNSPTRDGVEALLGRVPYFLGGPTPA